MGNTICTEAEPSSLRSITQHAASCTWCQANFNLPTTANSYHNLSPASGRRNAEDELLANTVLEQVYRGVYHNVRVFRLSLKTTQKNIHASPSSSSGVAGSTRRSTATVAARRAHAGRVRRGYAGETHALSRTSTSAMASLARGSQHLSRSPLREGHEAGQLSSPLTLPNERGLRETAATTTPPLLANIACDPVVLTANEEVCAADTDVFLLLHIERVPLVAWAAMEGNERSAFVSPRPPGMGEEAFVSVAAAAAGAAGGSSSVGFTGSYSLTNEEADVSAGSVRVAPRWAQDMQALFTPRGLTTILAGNVDKPMSMTGNASSSSNNTARAMTGGGLMSARGEACEFVYSIHLLNGKQAHPLLAAGAVLHALQLERVLKEQPGLLRCLFYNCRGYTNNNNNNTGGSSHGGGGQSNRAHSAVPGSAASLARPPASSGRSGRPSMPFRRPATIRAALRMAAAAATASSCSPDTIHAAGGHKGIQEEYNNTNISSTPHMYASQAGGKHEARGGLPSAVPLHEAVARNAVLRVLLRNAHLPPPQAQAQTTMSGASPHSVDFSVTSVSNTPRCSLSSGSPRNQTPRPIVNTITNATSTMNAVAYGPPYTSAGNFASAFLPKGVPHVPVHSATPSLSLAPQLQGPPPLEIPRLRFSGLAQAQAQAAAIASQRAGNTSEPAAPASALATPSLMTTMTAHSTGAESTRTTTTITTGAAAEPAVIYSPTTSASPLTSAHARTTSVSRPTILLAQTRREQTNTTTATTTSSPPPVMDEFTATTTTTTATVEDSAAQQQQQQQQQQQASRETIEQEGDDDSDERARSEEWDELAMTEERAQRLKLAAPDATEVLPWLYVGGEAAAKDRSQLLAKGITAVVNTVAFDLPNYHEDLFHYLDLYLCDSPDEPIFCVFPVVNAFIERARVAGGRTFVHCHQGVSRSCALVIAYVMWKKGMCYDEAYAAVRRCRNVCSPNTGFYVHLHLWERHLAMPVRSRAYAYVPYSASYAFPLAFRLALTLSATPTTATATAATSAGIRANGNEGGEEEDDEGAHLFNPAVQRVTTRHCDCSLDPRLTYGFLLPHATANNSNTNTTKCTSTTGGASNEPGVASTRSSSPATSKSAMTNFLWHGDACPPLVAQQAELAWQGFLRYNFYHGPPHESVNDRGERILFRPATELQLEESEPGVVFSAYAVECQINHWFAASSLSSSGTVSTHAGMTTATAAITAVAPHCSVRCAHDPHWDALLLSSPDLTARLTAQLAEETQRGRQSPHRKRAREEEQRRLLRQLPDRRAKTSEAYELIQHTVSRMRATKQETGSSHITSSSPSSSSSSSSSADDYLSATSSRSLHGNTRYKNDDNADINNVTMAPAPQYEETERSDAEEHNDAETAATTNAANERVSQRSMSGQASMHEAGQEKEVDEEEDEDGGEDDDRAGAAPQDAAYMAPASAVVQDEQPRALPAMTSMTGLQAADTTNDAAADADAAVQTSNVAAAAAAALDFEVYAYPFTRKDRVEVIGMADLSSETCYAIVLPAIGYSRDTANIDSIDTGNQVYLWIGECCPQDATAALRAFERNLAIKPRNAASVRAARRRRGAGKQHTGEASASPSSSLSALATSETYNMRLSSGAVLKSVTVVVVYEGEEPDDLLLVLD